jgi:hypothetical protein
LNSPIIPGEQFGEKRRNFEFQGEKVGKKMKRNTSVRISQGETFGFLINCLGVLEGLVG